jgi:formylglycine-generating enzyme required for sulfatase activity/predicted Ser/Thr protein kinase
MTINPGQVLNGRYRVVKMLGQGGFGAVFRAWDMNLERPCALKLNLDTSPGAQSQFLREAQMLSNLHHPNLPRVIDHFIIPGQGQYLVMDFIQGSDLEKLLENASGGLPESQVLPWIEQVCEALIYLHHQVPPVIHRDIKPKNIIITPDNRAVLVDFGIAKVNQPGQQTTQGARAVTPGYSPPEQYGAGGTNEQSDVYALGATLYSLLTGQVPVESIQRNQTTLTPPSMLNPNISAGVEYAILKAMEYAPPRRYASVAELISALRSQPVVGYSSTLQVAPQTQQPVEVGRSRPGPIPRWLILLGVFLVLACISVGGYLIWQVFFDTQESVQVTPRRIDTPVVLNERFKTPSEQPPEAEAPTMAVAFTDLPTLIPTLVSFPKPVSPTDIQVISTLVPTPFSGYPTDIGSDGMVLVLVPEGKFLMGAPESDTEAAEKEKPQHDVYLSNFWIDQTEVSNAMFERFAQATGYQTSAEKLGWGFVGTSGKDVKIQGANWRHPFGPSFSIEGMGDYPVTQMTWQDADAYCRWVGRRLPTEAEWEKAASWNEQTRTKYLYPWGIEAPDGSRANFADRRSGLPVADGSIDDGFQLLAPVGSFPEGASPYGLLDMAGNVWEWVWDFVDHTYYQYSPPGNPRNEAKADFRIARGGSWENSINSLRTTRRGEDFPGNPSSSVGFRCAR